MPPPTAQTGLVNTTDIVKNILPRIKKGIDSSYVAQLPLLRYFYSKGRVEGVDSYVCEWLTETNPSPSAGWRGPRERVPSDNRNYGNTSATFDINLRKKNLYLSHVYAGLRRDGLVIEAQKAAGSKNAFGNVLKLQLRRCMEQMKHAEEVMFAGNGTGELAEVASVSGNTAVLKQANGTLANAGQFGAALVRWANRMLVAIDPVTGQARSGGGGQGFRVVTLNKTTATLTLDRTVAGVWVAGDILVEGDNDSMSYGRGFPGVDAWVGNADDRLHLFGLNRTEPDNDFLNALTIDMQTDAGNLGELNHALINEGQIDVNFENDGKIDTILHHPKMHLEHVWGDAQPGTATTAPLRNTNGYQFDRRYLKGGQLSTGFSGVQTVAGKYGTVTFVPQWNVRPNNLYGLPSGVCKVFQYKKGVTPLGGGAGDDGQALRVPFYDIYDWAWRRSVTFCVSKGNTCVRWRNVLQEQPRF